MRGTRRGVLGQLALLASAAAGQGCYLIDYDPLRFEDSAVEKVADGGDTAEASIEDASDPARPDGGPSDAAYGGIQVFGDAAGWWADAAVTRLCAAPGCDLMCNGPSCVFDCAGETSCKTHCMANSRCYSDCVDGADCEFRCDAMSDCALDCSGNPLGSCTTKCDADTRCQIDCSGVASCNVRCDMGAVCDIDCRDSTDCSQLSCDKDANCLAYCGNNARCNLDCSGGGAMSCPGAVFTCNRDCP